jgi:cell shape-determining protein MreC
LTEIPVNVKLEVGERVVTQGQDGIAPNIFVGRIASLESKPEAAVQTAVIEQVVSFYEATIVEVR